MKFTGYCVLTSFHCAADTSDNIFADPIKVAMLKCEGFFPQWCVTSTYCRRSYGVYS